MKHGHMFLNGWFLAFGSLLIGFAFVSQGSGQQAAAPCPEWNLAADFRVFPGQENPSRDSCGNPDVWSYLESDPNTFPAHNPSTYRVLQEFIQDAFSISDLEQWQGSVVSASQKDKLPAVGINNTGAVRVFPGWAPGVIRVHPLYNKLAIVGWRSPVSGPVMVTGGVNDMDNTYGNGILWFIDRFDGVTNSTLASGFIREGGAQNFQDGIGGAGLASVAVGEGDLLYFIVDPGGGDHEYDSTGLTVVIRPTVIPCTQGACDDFNECTHDACDPATGTCRYDPVSCDDGNPCTTDVCFNGGGGCLSHGRVAAGTACDDGRSCTQSDVCDGSGHCVGQRQPEDSLCDDRNACTVSDLCDAGGACMGTTLPPGSACDDGDACTSGDTCTATAAGEVVCQAERRACDDGDPCTVDACDAATGACVVAPKPCDDGNPCTNDSCDPATGTCLRSFASGSCEDGNLCTENDICASGKCVAGTASGVSCHPAGNLCGVGRCFGSSCVIVDSACDDLNPCTADSCVDPSVGTCVHSSLEGLVCEDNDRCTTGEICTNGTCGGGVPLSCDDGVDCTVDSCSQTYGCVHEPPPGDYDRDGDRVPDSCDNCPTIYNPDQSPEACLQTLVDVTIAYGALGRPGWMVSWTTTHEVTLLGFKIVSIDNQERVTSLSELIRCVECITGAGYTYSAFVPKYKSGRSVHVSLIDQSGTTIGTFGAVRIH